MQSHSKSSNIALSPREPTGRKAHEGRQTLKWSDGTKLRPPAKVIGQQSATINSGRMRMTGTFLLKPVLPAAGFRARSKKRRTGRRFFGSSPVPRLCEKRRVDQRERHHDTSKAEIQHIAHVMPGDAGARLGRGIGL